MKVAVIIPAAGSGERFTASVAASGREGRGVGGEVGADDGVARNPLESGEAAADAIFDRLANPATTTTEADPLAAASALMTKIEHDILGKPIFRRAIDLFADRREVSSVVLAVAPDRLDEFRERHGASLGFQGVKIVAGGTADRWETIQRALTHVPESATHIAVHDAARPVTSAALIDRVFAAARRHPAVIPAQRVAATLKRVGEPITEPDDTHDSNNENLRGNAGVCVWPIEATVPRDGLVEAQTPQVFEAALLRRAYAGLDQRNDRAGITDDAGLVEALGETVWVVDGEPGNLKITVAADLELARALAVARQPGAARADARDAHHGMDLSKRKFHFDDP